MATGAYLQYIAAMRSQVVRLFVALLGEGGSQNLLAGKVSQLLQILLWSCQQLNASDVSEAYQCINCLQCFIMLLYTTKPAPTRTLMMSESSFFHKRAEHLVPFYQLRQHCCCIQRDPPIKLVTVGPITHSQFLPPFPKEAGTESEGMRIAAALDNRRELLRCACR